MQVQTPAIRFLKPWRGRVVEQVDTQIQYGVMVELVRRGIATWTALPTPQAKPKRRKR